MGWEFIHRSKQETIDILLSSRGETIAHALSPTGLWVIHRVKGRAYINCFALRYMDSTRRGWWVRLDGEDDWCAYHDCPLHLLDLAPTYSTRWRYRVYQYHRVACRYRQKQALRSPRAHRHLRAFTSARCAK